MRWLLIVDKWETERQIGNSESIREFACRVIRKTKYHTRGERDLMDNNNVIEDNIIQMKTIGQLAGKNFFIPSYQRGYRWNEQQAIDLLEDIEAFINKTKQANEIYCIQPLVVAQENGSDEKKPNETRWRVVDGQQRLTTIFLLLKYLEGSKPDFKTYSIEYERGVGSKEFLDNIYDKKEKDALDNVDFYHMYLVYCTIKNWFKGKASKKNNLKKTYKKELLNKVYFIWNPVDKTQETKIFTDLNSGRIALTDSELVKAMFLNRNNFKGYKADEMESLRDKIAKDWYTIENTLQNDEFWMFIHSKTYRRPTRIDFILELMCTTDFYNIKDYLGKKVYTRLEPEELYKRLGKIAYYREFDLSNNNFSPIYYNHYIMTFGRILNKYLNDSGDSYNNKAHKLFKRKYQKTIDTYKDIKELGKAADVELRKNEAEFREERIDDKKVLEDLIQVRDGYIGKLGKIICNKRVGVNNSNPEEMLGEDELDILMSDEHGIFRYFNEVFAMEMNNPNNQKWIESLWKEIKNIFDIICEWYNDYKMFHYIGYLVAVKGVDAEDFIGECIKLWQGNKAEFDYNNKKIQINERDKESFVNNLKKEIVFKLKNDESVKKTRNRKRYVGSLKRNFINDLIEGKVINGIDQDQQKGAATDDKDIADYLIAMNFEQENGYSKRCCVNMLLLHSVESTIQYNDMLLNNNRYTLPYFTRFPFHLYNSENWDVEHIRPNAGDALHKEEERLLYLLLAIKFFSSEVLMSIPANDEIINALEGCYAKDNLDNIKLYNAIEKYINTTEETDLDYYKLDDAIKKASDEEKPNLEILKILKKREEKGLFEKICEAIDNVGGKELEQKSKNKIWNYTLLDSSTNREYGNHIFPYKRAYIAEKKRGHKLRYAVVKNKSYAVVENEVAPLRYEITEVRHRKNEIVRMLWVYENIEELTKENTKNLKDKIENYINNIDQNSKLYVVNVSNEIGKEDRNRIQELSKKCNPDSYSIRYLKKTEHNGGLKFALVKSPEESVFVLNTTENVFTKFYSDKVATMLHWTKEDAEKYWENMKSVLKYYFEELTFELKNTKDNKSQQNKENDKDE